MSDKKPRDVAQSYWKAECARDLEGVLENYHEDAVFVTPDGALVGHAEISGFYKATFERFPGLRLEIVHEISNGNQGSLEWEAALIDGAGNVFPLRGVNNIRIRDGKFEEVRTYFDPTLLLR